MIEAPNSLASKAVLRASMPRTLGAALAVLLLTLSTFACGPRDEAGDHRADSAQASEQASEQASAEAVDSTPEPAAETDPLRNTLRWKTASEVDNFGFDVYRGDSQDGPFVRLTEEPVEGAGTSDEPHSYSWVDETNDPTKDYYYYVESISMSNVRARFTPVIHAKPKQPAAAPEQN